jgi:hypothetical protein
MTRATLCSSTRFPGIPRCRRGVFRGTKEQARHCHASGRQGPPAPRSQAFRSKAPSDRRGFFLTALPNAGDGEWNNRRGRRLCVSQVDRNGARMFERLLEPGCTESPACQCGTAMAIASIEVLPEGSDAAVRVYRCTECDREMRLTVWAKLLLPVEDGSFAASAKSSIA